MQCPECGKRGIKGQQGMNGHKRFCVGSREARQQRNRMTVKMKKANGQRRSRQPLPEVPVQQHTSQLQSLIQRFEMGIEEAQRAHEEIGQLLSGLKA